LASKQGPSTSWVGQDLCSLMNSHCQSVSLGATVMYHLFIFLARSPSLPSKRASIQGDERWWCIHAQIITALLWIPLNTSHISIPRHWMIGPSVWKSGVLTRSFSFLISTWIEVYSCISSWEAIRVTISGLKYDSSAAASVICCPHTFVPLVCLFLPSESYSLSTPRACLDGKIFWVNSYNTFYCYLTKFIQS
jgi:hypothetical protein